MKVPRVEIPMNQLSDKIGERASQTDSASKKAHVKTLEDPLLTAMKANQGKQD